MTTDTIELDVCVDCLVYLANGPEDETGRQTGAAIAREWPGYHLMPACDEDCEGHFSWSQCQGCGSTLGGDRHPAVAFPI